MEEERCFKKEVILRKDRNGWKEKGILIQATLFTCQTCYTEFLSGPRSTMRIKNLVEITHPSIINKL
jgi:hypothetical protein